MAIKTRSELKKTFTNGALPTAQDFGDLFESVLNRKDDCFFGKWIQGTRYCHGSMVLYCGSLYVLNLDGVQDDECDKKKVKDECEPCDDDSPMDNMMSKCICSERPPTKDNRWKPLTVKVQDEDWVVEDRDGDKDYDVMYSNEAVEKVGIGTKEPKATLDINIVGKGAFLFSHGLVDGENAPTFVIRQETDKAECPEVKQSVVTKDASWHTNSSGYAFRQKPGIKEEEGEEAHCGPNDGDSNLLVRITKHNGKPALGINTPKPEAPLHAKEDNMGEIKLQTSHEDGPYVYMANLEGDHKNYLKTTVENEATVLRTKEGSSFFFRHIEAENDYDPCNDESPAVAINPDGKVGIGTEKPTSHLDIVDKVDEKGRFRLSFEEKNPALAIINTRPREETNYLTIGVDNNRGSIVTDSPHGIEIKTGSPCIRNNNDVNINQDGGDTMMSIFPNGSVGIGRHPRSETYALDVEGKLTASGMYLSADSRNMKDAESLDGEQVLADLKKLDPIKFNWKNGTGGNSNMKQEIGLRAKDVDEVFPQAVLSPGGQPESIAYQNLVAVLVAAVNRLTQRVEELEGRK